MCDMDSKYDTPRPYHTLQAEFLDSDWTSLGYLCTISHPGSSHQRGPARTVPPRMMACLLCRRRYGKLVRGELVGFAERRGTFRQGWGLRDRRERGEKRGKTGSACEGLEGVRGQHADLRFERSAPPERINSGSNFWEQLHAAPCFYEPPATSGAPPQSHQGHVADGKDMRAFTFALQAKKSSLSPT